MHSLLIISRILPLISTKHKLTSRILRKRITTTTTAILMVGILIIIMIINLLP